MLFAIKVITYDTSGNHTYITNWVFSERSLDTSFYWSNQANHKFLELIILILISNPLKNVFNCTSRSKLLLVQAIFFGRNRGYLDRGRERGNPI
jgi:hypothetical protein